MKKIILLFSAILCCLSSYASITLTANPSSTSSPGLVTVTASGETSSGYISVVGTVNGVFAFPTINTASGSVQGVINYYAVNVGTPTSFALNVSSPNSTQTTATYYINITTHDAVHNTNTATTLPVTVIINPTPVFWNIAESGTYTRNNCGTGSTGSSVLYTVAAHTYSASTQAAANQLAINDVNANGQTYANSHGTCTACTGALSGTTIDGVAFSGSRAITIGYHTLAVTYTGSPYRLVFINNTQYASISSQIPANYPNTPTGGTGSCYFYYIGGGTAIIAINVTDSCGNLTITNVSFHL